MKFKMRGKKKAKVKHKTNDGAELVATVHKQKIEEYVARMYKEHVKDPDAETE